MKNTIEVKNLNYSIRGKKILKNINMNFNAGTLTAVIGPSRSGKSTLLKLLAGILPNHDSITYNYSYINFDKKNSDILDFGYASSSYKFLFDDVYSELTFPLLNLCLDKEIISNRIKDILKYFDLTYLLDKKIANLTSYEEECLELMLAIIHLPKVLVIDQLFSYSGKNKKKCILEKLFKYVRENNILLIIATNNLEDIIDCDYTYVLNNGEIAIEGNTFEVLKEDVNLKKIGLKLPFAVDISLMFNFYQIMDDVYTDVDGVVNELWK